jgi:hypothetical protein
MAEMEGAVTESHLHQLSTSEWSLWRWICVRGAGFPADKVLALASSDTSDAVDRILEFEAELEAARARALVAVELDLETKTERAERRTLATYLRRLRAGGVPDATHGLDRAAAAAIAALQIASLAYQQHRDGAANTLAAERQRCAQVLREVARDSLFREAVEWQNPHALHTGVDALLRQPDAAANAKVRGYERLVASHVQRYCVKNETISFFGPVGWATLEREGPAITVEPGDALLAKRTVYFEHWGIEALAVALAKDPELRPHLAPRRHPNVWLEGTLLHHVLDQTSELPLEFARLLDACDGRRSARDIALQLVQDSELELSDENQVYELLEQLAAKRLAIWALEIPTHVEHPDRVLGDLLEAVPDRDAAAPALAKLAELQAARDGVSRAAGDASALALALARLDETFTQHTGVAATRRAGETYAGRTLVYEDCRRDLAMTIGPALIDRLSTPLSLLLTSARWFTYTIAQRYREAVVALHRELELETGSSTIDFLRFWERATDLFGGDSRSAPPLVAAVTEELQRRWTAILGLDAAACERHQLTASGDQLAAAVAKEFAAPGPGWPAARAHSPDVMIAADSASAIAREDFVLVAGELHVACATVAAPWTVRQHPNPEQLVEALHHERSLPIVEPVASKETAARADVFSILPGDLDLELGVARSRRERGRVVEAGSLVVVRAGESLQINSRDGQHAFVLEQFLSSFLSNASASHFRVLPPLPHCPRVSIDKLVVGRESWRFDGTQLEFARVEDPLDRMLATRRWARSHRLPRFSFYKIPEETKPCYLDLDSPHYVDVFCHLARKATQLVVSEMLPTVDHAWLPDRHGARYTSELRIVAIDPELWRPV